MAKEWAQWLYKSKPWKKVREFVLRRDRYMCQCYKLTGESEPCGNPAEEVHHIERLTPENIHDPRITFNSENLISLFGECHKREHKDERTKKGPECGEGMIFDENGMIVEVSNGTK